MEMSKRLTIRGQSAKHTTHPLIVVALIALGFVVGRLSITASWAASGTLDSPAPPGSTFSYTLEDVYSRLNDGTTGTQSAFAEPASGPTAGTGHTLDEIYDLIGERAPVPKTGQTLCYTATAGESEACPEDSGTYPGQDGDHQKGVAWPIPRFTDNGDGTVTDNLTGLTWLKSANCFGLETWAQALSAANGLASGNCGLTDGSSAGDWRLPNVRELQSLIDYGHSSPALPNDHPFTSVQSDYYWSSTTYAFDSANAFNVVLSDGDVDAHYKTTPYYMWPVRGGQSFHFQGPWEIEDNDSYQQANGALYSGKDYYGYPDDAKDYFSIYLRTGGDITVDLTGHTGSGVQLHLYYQSVENRVDYDLSVPYHIEHTGAAGWYYIYIYTESGYSSTPYTLRVTHP